MWRILFLVVLSVTGTAFGAIAAEGPVRASAVRLGNHGTATRFVVELSGPIKYRTFRIARPWRIIVDLPELSWRAPTDGPRRRNRVVKSYRYGAFTAGANRIVIELRQPAAIKRSFMIPPRGRMRAHRLVLDLETVSAARFMNGLRAPKRVRRHRRPALRLAPRRRRPAGEKPVIVLDPGHGGIDSGAMGATGTREKRITLRVARRLRRGLLATGKYKVVMTRDSDLFVRLRERIAIARRASGDLFISLHADTIGIKWFRGASVYTLSEKASDEEAAALARKENKSDIIAGIDLGRESGEVRNILIDLAQRETMNRSVRFARFLVEDLSRGVALVRNKKHRFAGFAVLKAPDVPSVLIELGYLSNRKDERLLRSANHHARLVRAIVRAVNRYIALQAKLSKT